MDGKELETIGSVLTLIGGLLEFMPPLETIWDLAQKTDVTRFPVEETLLAILAVIGCIIIWKGASLGGGVMNLVVGILILQSPTDFKYRSISGVLIIIGGLIALTARFWRASEASSGSVKRP